MKTAYLFLPAALLIGLVIGGWGPRSELRALKKDLQAARKLIKSGEKRSASDVEEMTQLLGIDREARRKTTEDSAPDAAAISTTNQALKSNAATAHTAANAGRRATTNRPRSARSMEEEIEKAIELWKLRSDIARDTFLANGDFTREDAMDFDVLMEAMNVRLEHTIAEWVETVKQKENVGPEDGIRLMNGVTDVLVLTYDEMDRKMPPDWRDTGGNDMRLMDFIDPRVAQPLIGVEDKLEQVGESFDDDEPAEPPAP